MPYPFPWSPVICECSWKKTQIEKQNKYCLPFYPPSNPKSQNSLEILSFYTCVPQMTIIWCMASETWSATDKSFAIFDLFSLFHPPPPPSPLKQTKKSKKKKLKWKKHLKISSFYTSVPNKLITWCAVLEIWFVMNRQMDGLTEGRSDM